MRHSRKRYQHGSIRKVPRANGFAWEFRFYCSDESGERKLKTQTFDALKYPTETAVRKAVEPQLGALNSDTLGGKISATMNTIIDRYYAEEFPSLRHSTHASADPLPIHPKLMPVLQQWRKKQDQYESWVFPSPQTGGPYSDSTILTDYLKPAAAKLGIKGLGWHTFRHSYRSWLSASGVKDAHAKDLMRHSDIKTTMNVYGKTVSKEMRDGNAR